VEELHSREREVVVVVVVLVVVEALRWLWKTLRIAVEESEQNVHRLDRRIVRC
jgi:hypothetical protein